MLRVDIRDSAKALSHTRGASTPDPEGLERRYSREADPEAGASANIYFGSQRQIYIQCAAAFLKNALSLAKNCTGWLKISRSKNGNWKTIGPNLSSSRWAALTNSSNSLSHSTRTF
jgi:hypothetical protein